MLRARTLWRSGSFLSRADLRGNAHPRSVTVRYPWHPLSVQAVIVSGATSHLGVASYWSRYRTAPYAPLGHF